MEDVKVAFDLYPPEVVIVSMSARRASDSPFAAPISPPRPIADCNANMMAAMKDFGIHKVVILQALAWELHGPTCHVCYAC